MSVKAFDNRKNEFVKIASLQSDSIIVNKEDFVSDNVDDALSELKQNLKKLKSDIAWIYENGTHGGGSGTGSNEAGTIIVDNFDENKNLILQSGQSASVVFRVASKQLTNFTVKVSVGDGLTKIVTVRPNVATTVNFGVLAQGTYNVIITGSDYTGYPLENWYGYIISGIISITTTFNSESLYDINQAVKINYTVEVAKSLAATRKLTVSYAFDGSTTMIPVSNPQANIVSYITFNENLEIVRIGEHYLTILATISDAVGTGVTEATLVIPFKVMSDKAIAVYIPNNASTVYNLGTTIRIPYTIVANPRFQQFYVQAKLYKSNNVNPGSEIDTFTDPAVNYNGLKMIIIDANVGSQYYQNGTCDYTLIFYKRDTANNQQGSYAVSDATVATVTDSRFDFTITDSLGDFKPWTAEQSGLLANFNMLGTKVPAEQTWKNEVEGSSITCDLIGCGNGQGFVDLVKPGEPNGVQPDKRNILQLNGEAYAVVNYEPFVATTNSNTISFTYKFSTVGLQSATILSCGNFDKNGNLNAGIWLNEDKINLSYGKNVVSEFNIDDEWICCDIVTEYIAEDHKKLLKIYINGVLSACSEAEPNDEYENSCGKIYLGCRHRSGSDAEGIWQDDIIDNYSDVTFKSFKIYNRALTNEEIVANYIAEDYYLHTTEDQLSYDSVKNLNLRQLNSLDANKQFIQNDSGCGLPRIYISFPSEAIRDRFNELTNTLDQNQSLTKEELECEIDYQSADGRVHLVTSELQNASSAKIKLQGTTSLGYNRKNYDISFGVWDASAGDMANKPILFTPKYGESNTDGNKDWIPENTFTLKCDLIDSSHANNVGTANAVSDIFESMGLKLPPMTDTNDPNHDLVKYAIDGFPVMLYIYDGKQDNVEQASFYGIYMFDLGRSTYNNLGLKNVQFELGNAQGILPCIAISLTDTTPASDTRFAYEVEANSNEGAGAFAKDDLNSVQQEWIQRYPETASENGYKALSRAITNAMKATVDGAGASGFEDSTLWNKDHLIVYLLIAYAFGMVDSLGKNFIVKSWDATNSDNDHWYPTFYDMDTVLGLDNSGSLYWRASVDLDSFETDSVHGGAFMQQLNNGLFDTGVDTDADEAIFKQLKFSTGTANGIGRGNGGYNSAKSRLWEAIRTLYYDDTTNTDEQDATRFITKYRRLRSTGGKFKAANMFSYYSKVINKIGQIYYNKDAEIKYLPKYTQADESGKFRRNLTYLHGTRELFTKRWLKQRIWYMDSRFMPRTTEDGYNTDSIGGRYADTKGPLLTLNVKSSSPVFVRGWNNDANTVEDDCNLLCDNNYWTQFNIKLKNQDTPIYVNNQPLLQYVNGFGSCTGKSLTLKNATQLIGLDISNMNQLVEINIDALRSLRSLNINGCSSLQSSAIDLSNCSHLQNIDISNTGISKITLPTTSTLKTLDAVNCALSGIDIKNLQFLETIDLSNCKGLTSISLSSCKNIKKLVAINCSLTNLTLLDCPKLEEIIVNNNSNLQNVSITACPNVKKLDISYCNTTAFAPYTGDEDTDYAKALDLLGCPNIEELIMTSCSVQVIKLNANCTSLKVLKNDGGKLVQTIRIVTSVNSDGQIVDSSRVYDTYTKKNGTVIPAIDLSAMTNMTQLTFKNNGYVRCVKGFKKDWKLSTYQMFYGCVRLHRITGELTLRDSYVNDEGKTISCTNGYEFANITNYTELVNGVNTTIRSDFQLNNWNANVNSNNFSTIADDFKLNIECKLLNGTFYINSGITMSDAAYVCFSARNVRKMLSTFYNTNLLKEGSVNTTIPGNLLTYCTNLTHFNSTFSHAGLNGQFPSNIFSSCPNLVACEYSFANNSFTLLGNDFTDVFKSTKMLESCKAMLVNNFSLVSSTMLDPSKIFEPTQKLKDCAYFLGFNGSMSSTQTKPNGDTEQINILDYFVDDTNYTSVRNIKFDATKSDRIFDNCPNLTYCQYAFPRCNFQGNFSPNVFGGQLTSLSGTWSDNTAYNFSLNILNIAMCFANSNITMELTNDIFSKLPNLTDCSGCFMRNTKVTGNIANLGSIFSTNTHLLQARKFFKLTGVTGVIPSGDYTSKTPSVLFRNNRDLTNIDYLFESSKVSGAIPDFLVGKCDKLANVDGIFKGCNQLTGLIPESVLYCVNNSGTLVTLSCVSAKETFRGCSGIFSTIPANLFACLTNVTSLSGFFRGCGSSANNLGVTGTIPPSLLSNLTNLTDVSYLFTGCWSISSVTEDDGTRNFIDPYFFSSNPRIETVKGMFMGTRPNNIPATLFDNLITLYDISYLFSDADRSNMKIYNTMFNKNKNIINISYFMGDENPLSHVNTNSYNDNGNNELATLFKVFDANTNTGQIQIKNANYAFANNEKMTGVIPAKFWEWGSKQPLTHERTYTRCGNNATVPTEYK